MTQMTPDQETEWLANHRRKRREEQIAYLRSRIRLVVNRGVTRLEVRERYRVRGRL